MAAILPCVTFGQIAEVLDAGEMSKSWSTPTYSIPCVLLWGEEVRFLVAW